LLIAIVGNKGGAGKTTLSVNLASLFNRDSSTALVDADPQGSSLQWRVISGNDEAVPVIAAEQDLHEQVKDLGNQFENVFVDCPPSVHAPQTDAVLKFSNAGGKELFSYNVDYGSKSWPVKNNTIESLGLNEGQALYIFVEEGIAPENESKQIVIPFYSVDNIGKEMLYVASRIDYLKEKTTVK